MLTERKLLVGSGITIFVIIFLLLSYNLFSELRDNPFQPVPSGNFPAHPVWVFEGSGRVVATPVVKGHWIFIRTLGSVYALDGSTGKLLWRANSTAPADLSVAPLVTNCCLIVPEVGSRIANFSIDSGMLLWRTPAIEDNLRNPRTATVGALVSLGNLFATARLDANITIYENETGDEIWQKGVPNRSTLYLAADEKVVYLSTSHFIRAFDARLGKLLWEMDFGTNVGAILLDGNILYIALHGGEKKIAALGLETMQEVWNIDYLEIEGDEVRSMIVDEEILFAGADRLIAIDKYGGSIKWTSNFTQWLETPVILGNTIYARNTGTTLFAFNRETGLETGRLLIQADTSLKQMPERGLAVVMDLLIVPFGDNRVFAYYPLNKE